MKLLGFFLLSFLSIQAFSQSESLSIKHAKGYVTVSGENFDKESRNYQVNISKNGSNIVSNEVTSNGRFTIRIKAKSHDLDQGDQLEVQVNQYDGDSLHWTRSITIPESDESKKNRQRRPRIETGKLENGSFTIVGRDFLDYTRPDYRYTIRFYKNGSYQAFKSLQVPNADGSFSYSTASGLVHKGDQVTIEVKDFGFSGFSKKVTVPISEEEKAAIQALNREIPDYAENEAQKVAMNIARGYAKLIRWRQSYSEAFYDNHEIYKESRTAFNSGLNQGRQNGSRAGFEEGKKEAEDLASSRARDKISDIYAAAIDNPGVLRNMDPTPPSAKFQAKVRSFNRDNPVSYRLEPEEKMYAGISQALESRIKGLTYVGVPKETIRNFNLDDISKYKDNDSGLFSNLDVISSNDAFDAWKQNGYNSPYQYNYTKWKNRYMTYELKSRFEDYFKDAFREEVARRIRIEYDHLSPSTSARNFGNDHGKQLGSVKAKEMGRRDGFNDVYAQAGDQAFKNNYGSTYSNQFKEWKDFYNSHAVIKNVSTKLIDENKNKLWEGGDTLSLKVNKIENHGRKNAVLKVSLSGNSITGKDHQEFNLPASSRVTNKVFENLAEIKTNLVKERRYTVESRIGKSTTQDHSFYFGWREALKGLSYKLIDENRDGVWEKGEYVSVLISQGENTSLVDAELNVTVESDGLQDIKTEKFDLDAGAMVEAPIEFTKIAKIKDSIIENSSYDITIKFGDMTQKTRFSVGFYNVVDVYIKSGRADLQDVIYKTLKTEFKTTVSLPDKKARNIYKGDQKSKLRWLVETVQNRDVKSKFKFLADKDLCSQADGYPAIVSRSANKTAKSFKKLLKNLDENCRIKYFGL